MALRSASQSGNTHAGNVIEPLDLDLGPVEARRRDPMHRKTRAHQKPQASGWRCNDDDDVDVKGDDVVHVTGAPMNDARSSSPVDSTRRENSNCISGDGRQCA